MPRFRWREAALTALFQWLLFLGVLLTPRVGDALEITGVVEERGSGSAIAAAAVECVEARLGCWTDDRGRFRLSGLSPGTITLRARRNGYRDAAFSITLGTRDTVLAPWKLEPARIDLPPVEVRSRSVRRETDPGSGTRSLTGAELRERLVGTIAGTLASVPGVAQRTLGPAPARPVVRGLGGDRLLLLEDGMSTGDLSATADDHAVTIDPAASRAIELVRGPGTLEFGSNVTAGVVNVRREYVPERLPDRWGVTATLQSESATDSRSLFGRATLPAGAWVASVDAVVRGAGDMRSPAGLLGNTELGVTDGAFGLARLTRRARMGAAVSSYRSRYGIPGGFLGGHLAGVDIDLERERVEARMDFRGESESAPGVEWDGAFTRYYHRELESRDLPAVSFGLLTWQSTARVRWGAPEGDGGAAGVTGEYRDFRNGFLSFTPPTIERAAATFAHQSWKRGDLRVQAGARVDARAVEPLRSGHNKAGDIRTREFSGTSGGLLAEWNRGGALTLTTMAMRTFLAPSVEHLFAEGPHLAAYAYEIGNSELTAEVGNAFTFAMKWERPGTRIQLEGFRNDFEHYLHSADTGELEIGPGAEGMLERFRFRGDPARLTGFEASVHIGRPDRLRLEAELAHVIGTLTRTGTPLTQMPPLHGRLAARLDQGRWRGGLTATGSAAQRRLGDFESSTAAYAQLSADVGWERLGSRDAMSVLLAVDNLTNAEARDHLSRIKSLMPGPGRSVRLLLSVRR